MSNNRQAVAQELVDAIIKDKRDDGSVFFKLKDPAPGWISDREVAHKCHQALDDRLPDDWVYVIISGAADVIAGCDDDDIDLDNDLQHEIAEILTDHAISDLTKWLASHNLNVDLVDEYVKESGNGDGEEGIAATIRGAQNRAITEIVRQLLELIIEEAEGRE